MEAGRERAWGDLNYGQKSAKKTTILANKVAKISKINTQKSQIGPKLPPGTTKMESKRAKLGSRAAKRVPRGTQEAQNGAPERPSWSKWRPKRLQIETKRCQNGSRWSQKCPQEGLMMENRNIEKTSRKPNIFL